MTDEITPSIIVNNRLLTIYISIRINLINLDTSVSPTFVYKNSREEDLFIDSTYQQFDAIIVGSGPGGATVARELTRRNKRVLILEWGGNAPIKGTVLQTIAMGGIPFKNVLLTKQLLAMVRGTTTGGSSIFYYGTAFDPPFNMLKKQGVDIADEIDEARNELPIAPLADHLIGPMAKRMMASARELGYDWQKLPKFVYQDKCRAECWRCNYGCPYGAKWNARMFVEEAVRNGAVLINGVKVTRVIIENNKATGVNYTERGVARKAFAPIVILSAGGIGSPIILRETGIKRAGYDYFFDPLIVVMGAVDHIKGGKEIPMATGIHMAEEGYVMTDMTVPSALYRGFAAEVFRFHQMFSHSKTLSIMVKAKDGLSGRLTNRGGVIKPLTKNDKKKLMKGYSRAKEILINAGAKNTIQELVYCGASGRARQRSMML